MKIKTLMLVILSNFFVTGGYAADGYVDFLTAVLGHDPAKVVPDTNVRITAQTHDQEYVDFRTAVLGHDPAKVVADTNVRITAQTQGNYVDFRTAVLGHDPAKVVADTNVRITAQTHDQEYPGFQPLMASHYPKYDFNNDGILTVEECQEGMKL